LHFVWQAVVPHLPQGHFLPTHCVAQHLSLQQEEPPQDEALAFPQVAQPLKRVAPMASARNIAFIVELLTAPTAGRSKLALLQRRNRANAWSVALN
jgi:hypothetical protein